LPAAPAAKPSDEPSDDTQDTSMGNGVGREFSVLCGVTAAGDRTRLLVVAQSPASAAAHGAAHEFEAKLCGS
jgi:hypothetical protein